MKTYVNEDYVALEYDNGLIHVFDKEGSLIYVSQNGQLNTYTNLQDFVENFGVNSDFKEFFKKSLLERTCPFCNTLLHVLVRDGKYLINCHNCKLRTRNFDSLDEAIEYWEEK